MERERVRGRGRERPGGTVEELALLISAIAMPCAGRFRVNGECPSR